MRNLLSLSLVTFLIIPTVFGQSRRGFSANRFELLSGRRQGKDTKTFWDTKYANANTTYVFGKKPAKFLAENYEYIPANSTVLDLGMGEGRNAVFLAGKGYKVTGIDISSVAVRKARLLAKEFGVRINAIVASLDNYKIKPESYDSIICFYYVDRKLNEKMMKWLKPGGVLIYEAHTDNQKQVKGSEGYAKEHLLRPGELLKMFPKMKVLKYQEPLHEAEYPASIILQKPKK